MKPEKDGYEIERKFLIKMPDTAALLRMTGCRAIEMVQTYLAPEGNGRARVRACTENGQTCYIYTKKKKVSSLTRTEKESQITKAEYDALLKKRDPERRTIRKMRYCIPYAGHVMEIDVYDFWQKQATLEVELQSETEVFSLPPEICVLREVSFEKGYTNAALAKKVVPEEC